jgi:hypothetical protein
MGYILKHHFPVFLLFIPAFLLTRVWHKYLKETTDSLDIPWLETFGRLSDELEFFDILAIIIICAATYFGSSRWKLPNILLAGAWALNLATERVQDRQAWRPIVELRAILGAMCVCVSTQFASFRWERNTLDKQT